MREIEIATVHKSENRGDWDIKIEEERYIKVDVNTGKTTGVKATVRGIKIRKRDVKTVRRVRSAETDKRKERERLQWAVLRFM